MPIEFAPPSPQIQPFNITPVQYTDPLETLARMQQLKTGNLQQQQAQLGLQQARRQMDSQRAMLKAFVDGGTDPEKTYNLMTQYGVLPNDLLSYQQHVNQLATQRATLRKDQQEIFTKDSDIASGAYKRVAQMENPTQDDLNAANAELDRQGISPQVHRITVFPGDKDHMMALANSVGAAGQIDERTLKGQQLKQETAATEASQASTRKTGIETTGLLKNQLAADVKSMPTDPATGTPTPAAWAGALNNPAYKDLNLPRVPTKDYIDKVIEYPIPEKDLPEYRINQAKAAAIQTLSKMSPQDLEAQVDAIMPPTNPMNAPTKSLLRNAIGRGDFAAVHQILKDAYDQVGRVQVAKETAQITAPIKVQLAGQVAAATAGAQLNATPGGAGPGGPNADLHGEEYLKTLPSALAAQVKNIATGGDVLPTRTSGASLALKNAVYQYDPTYTPLLGQKRRETLHEFTKTGPSSAGGNVIALNTMIHHADLYLETAEALNNGTFRPGNEVWNRVKETFGKAPPTNAGLVAQFFAGETAKVAGEQTQGAVNELLDKMKTYNSPEQIRGAGQTLLGIAAGRMVPYKERIADAKLEGIAPPVLGPESRAILTRRGFDPETMKPATGGRGGQTGGGTALQYVRMAAGANGHQIGQTADGKWHDVQTGAVIPQ